MIRFGFNQVEIGGGDSWIKEPDIRNVLAGIQEVGATDVRLLVAWDFIEKSPGRYDPTALANLDRALNLCSEYGLAPLLLVSVGSGRGGDGTATAYGNFCRMLATRYGPAGSAQANAFEIWNEENWSLFFSPVSAPTYVEFLRAAHDGIKAVHPSGTVITGGTATIGTGTGFGFSPLPPFVVFANSQDPLTFIKGIIDAGALAYCDAVGYHWYSQNDQFAWEQPKTGQITWERLKNVRDYITAKGGAQNVWLTEVGYPYPSIPALTTCRDYLRDQIDLIVANQDFIDAVFYYSYRNTGSDTGNLIHQYGVVNYDFSKKQPLWDFVKTIPGLLGGTVVRPDPPTGVAVTGHTTTSVTLMWEASTISIDAPAAVAIASAPAPGLSFGSIISAPAAAATAAAPVPAFTASSTLTAPAAAATASAAAPTVSASGGTTLSAPAAAATASAPAPALATSSSLATPAATATAAASNPAVTASSSMAPPAATATAAAANPTLTITYRAHNDPNLIVDVDPNTLTGTLNNNDPISTITPTAGLETGALTQPTGTQQPLFKTSAVNGKPSMFFDGSNDRIFNTSWSTSYGPGFVTTPTPVTLFAVVKGTTGDFINGANSGVFLACRKTATTTITCYAGDTTNTVTITDNNNAWEIVCVVWNGASTTARVNTTAAGSTGTTGTSSNARLNSLRIGCNSGGTGNFFSGELARLMLVKGQVSDANIALEMAALGSDYGITVT